MSHAELQRRIIESKNEEIAKLRELLTECKKGLGKLGFLPELQKRIEEALGK